MNPVEGNLDGVSFLRENKPRLQDILVQEGWLSPK